MGNADGDRKELKNTGYEIFIGILSILSMVNIVMMYAADDPNLDTVIEAMNVLLSIVFLADFTYRLLTAASKSGYFFRAVRLGRSARQPAAPAGQDSSGLPPRASLPTPSRIRNHEHRSQPDQGQGR